MGIPPRVYDKEDEIVKKDIAFLVISGISVIGSFFNIRVLPFDLAWIAIVLCGLPIIYEAVVGLVTEFDIKADVLVSIALVASIVIGEIFAAGEVALIMQLGALLEEITVAKAKAGIEKLVKLTPLTARLVSDNDTLIIDSKDVAVGNILRVLPGESVPVDGLIVYGQTSINQAVMTGESIPVDKGVGDEVFSGTVNQYGAFDMRATRVGEDSSIQRMVSLVQSADANRAKVVGIADKMATWIVVIALTASVLTGFISGEIIRAVTILVVFCPCSLVLATPTAIMAAIGNATRHGFLVKEGNTLEVLSKIDKIAFDKTGTLTNGTPKVTSVKSFNKSLNEEDLFYLAACVETMSEHPLGKAVVNSYKENFDKELMNPKEFKMIPGQGIEAVLDEKDILAGNEKMMQFNNIEISSEIKEQVEECIGNGSSIIYIAIAGKLTGFVALTDTLRKDAKEMISAINSLKICSMLITGDGENAAYSIAGELGIETCHANCMPEDKLKWIDTYQNRNELMGMIGDGINDAAALKKADVGIAMGGIGSDIAVDAADIVIVNDNVEELPHLLALSKHMMSTIKINIVFSMLLNFIAIVLAITGTLNPIVGALVHNAGSVLVISNSALLLRWKYNYK